MGKPLHKMSKRGRTRPKRGDESVYVFTVRDLQNGIGIAGVVGIALILVYLGFDSGSPAPQVATTAPASDSTPFTLTTPDASSDDSGALLPIAGSSSVPASWSLASGSTTSATGMGNHPAGHTAASTSASSLGAATPNSAGLSGAVATQPQVPTTTTTSTTPSSTSPSSTTTTTATTTTTTTAPGRPVQGTAVTLGSGQFTGGTDVAPGLYDVTAGSGQSGHFVVSGTDSYNEVLDASGSTGVPEIRVQISSGDQLQISGLSQVFFTPVSTPFVTTQSAVTLYAGTWTVGQDLGPGTYVATPGPGQSGTLVIQNEGVRKRLNGDAGSGSSGSVTFTVQAGDVIAISGLPQVTLSPS